MRLHQRIIAGGLVVAGLAGLLGCDQRPKGENSTPKSEYATHFSDRGRIGQVQPYNNLDGIGVATGDMDGDGDLDVVVALANKGQLRYFENTGNGNFSDRGRIGQVQPYNNLDGIGVATGDMDGDGDLDVVVALANKGQLRYFENNLPQKNK